MNLKELFLNQCSNKKLEINNDQVHIVNLLNKFYQENFNKSFYSNLFFKNKDKNGFYLYGDVGVGKTMILNFFYDKFNQTKQRLHFNEFMINFHNFVFCNKNNKDLNIIDIFVNDLKNNYRLIYFDEFQVTNIVDAMILGNLFKKIFNAKIKVIFSSNIKIDDLYKEGLQRGQFLPFIKIMKSFCHEEKLSIKDDYRKKQDKEDKNYFFPLNEVTNFKINKFFRKITKDKINQEKILLIKGRKFIIKDYYSGIARFDFNNLCNQDLGAEDYIAITKVCNFIVIENLLNFNENNFNQQQRFITLIDIIYEKNIPLAITAEANLESLTSFQNFTQTFKRTVSRLHELTSVSYKKI